MRLRDLREMPVTDIEAIDYLSPDHHGSHSFKDDRDWALVSRKSMQDRIVRYWRNSKYKYRLYFFRLPVSPSRAFVQTEFNAGVIKTPRDYAAVRKDFFNKGMDMDWPDPVPGEIVVVQNQHDEALDRLTPWIVGHRIAHALHMDFDFENSLMSILEDWNVIYQEQEEGNYTSSFHVSDTSMFTMRSVTKGKLSDPEELYHEILTQFIVTGSVKTKTGHGKSGIAEAIQMLFEDYFDNNVVGKVVLSY